MTGEAIRTVVIAIAQVDRGDAAYTMIGRRNA
jgi:hypothetical protein